MAYHQTWCEMKYTIHSTSKSAYLLLFTSLFTFLSFSLSLFLYILSLFSFAIISSSLFSLFHMQLDGMHLFRNCLITLSFIQMKDSIGYGKLITPMISAGFYRLSIFYCFSRIFSTWYLI